MEENMEKNSQDEIVRAYVLLKSLRKNIDKMGSIPEIYVQEYHTIIDKLENNTNITLTEFLIPDSEIQPEPRYYHPSTGTKYSKEKYTAHAFMFTKMDAVLSYFEIITSQEPRRMGFHKSED